jgi:Prp8 binding protein
VEERYSSLLAPIMQLTGHRGPVYTSRFNPDGSLLASASFDKTICESSFSLVILDLFALWHTHSLFFFFLLLLHTVLWNVFGDCKNTAVLNGHKNAVLEANWSPNGHSIYSCSADKTVALWDVETATRTRNFLGHTAVVHAVSMTPKGRPSTDGDYNLILSVSDDCRVKVGFSSS